MDCFLLPAALQDTARNKADATVSQSIFCLKLVAPVSDQSKGSGVIGG
jgi:hypothetical protein